MSYYRNSQADLIYDGEEYIPVPTPEPEVPLVTVLSDGTNTWPLKATAIKNHNNAEDAETAVYDWYGTYQEYIDQQIALLHPNWVCYVEEDSAEDQSQIIRREVAERNLGEIVYSIIPIADGGLHLLDGSVLQGNGIYKDFYNYMVSISSTASQIFCSESDWQTSISTYGVCGKFVLDTTNNTIRLPKITGFVEGTVTLTELGTLVEAGLPNISGSFSTRDSGGTYNDGEAWNTKTGAFSGNTGTYNHVQASAAGGWGPHNGVLSFDASRSSAIYGSSDTVQPQSIKGYIYIVIANTTKTEIEVDIDQIAVDLNNKVDKGFDIVEFQEPTADNNYTWYKKYRNGWVEQGGYRTSVSNTIITLLIPMADTNYTLIKTINNDYQGNGNSVTWGSATAVKISTTQIRLNQTNGGDMQSWQVSGMAA